VPQISIASVNVPGWSGATSGISLRIYANQYFTAWDGTPIEQTVPKNASSGLGSFFKSYACTVDGSGNITIPAVTLPSTVDSPDNPSATYTALFWDATLNQNVQIFGTFASWPLLASPSATTWAAIFGNVAVVGGAAILVGTVTALPYGATPTATITSANPYYLNLGIPIADALQFLPCTSINAHTFTAPATVIAVAYNGIMLPANVAAPAKSYTVAGDGVTITLTFDIDPSWERIDAFCRPGGSTP